MNYLMCYFCSPEQEFWYRSDRLHICDSYCNTIYNKCKDAKYKGFKIGEEYKSGKHFCEAQLFKVVESKYERCFEFDSSLFGTAPTARMEVILIASMVFLTMVMGFW